MRRRSSDVIKQLVNVGDGQFRENALQMTFDWLASEKVGKYEICIIILLISIYIYEIIDWIWWIGFLLHCSWLIKITIIFSHTQTAATQKTSRPSAQFIYRSNGPISGGKIDKIGNERMWKFTLAECWLWQRRQWRWRKIGSKSIDNRSDILFAIGLFGEGFSGGNPWEIFRGKLGNWAEIMGWLINSSDLWNIQINTREIADLTTQSLKHSHFWVQFSACRLVGVLFSQYKIDNLRDDTKKSGRHFETNLESIIDSLSRIFIEKLRSSDCTLDMSVQVWKLPLISNLKHQYFQITKNLVFILRCIREIPLNETKTSFKWLITQLSRICRYEIAKYPDMSIRVRFLFLRRFSVSNFDLYSAQQHNQTLH